MEELEESVEQEVTQRPKSLTILCILTFIFTGIGCLSALFTPFFSDTVLEFLKNSPNYDATTMSDTLLVLQAGWGYYLLTFFLAVGSLTGALLMWKLKKIGFHVYSFSNLALLFLPTLVLGMAVSTTAIFFTIGFIGMYALNLKFMR